MANDHKTKINKSAEINTTPILETASHKEVKNKHTKQATVWSKLKSLLQNIFKHGKSLSSMQLRVISAIILIPIVLAAVYISQISFAILIVAIAILMTAEWSKITLSETQNSIKWSLGGFLYVWIPCTSMLLLRCFNNGANLVIWVLFIVWATDTAGLFVGKTLEGPKLAPEISPGKTWSGLIGGVIASMLIGFLSSFIVTPGSVLFLTLASGLLAIVEQASDLLESKLKRHFGLKDSGNLIPGHGGILDRVDGLVLTAPAALLIVLTNLSKFIL